MKHIILFCLFLLSLDAFSHEDTPIQLKENGTLVGLQIKKEIIYILG